MKDLVKSIENTGHIRYKQYIWKVPCKYQGGVAREAYGGWVTGPGRRSCSASSVPCKYRALQGTTLYSLYF
jgi:hypothetical protein